MFSQFTHSLAFTMVKISKVCETRSQKCQGNWCHLYPREPWGGVIVLTSNSGLQGFHDPLSLSQDGSPGPIPFPWTPQTVLVWGAGPKENFHGQLWIWEKQEQQVGLHPNQSGNFIHVLNVVHLDCVPGCLHIPKAETEYGRKTQLPGLGRSFNYFYLRGKEAERDLPHETQDHPAVEWSTESMLSPSMYSYCFFFFISGCFSTDHVHSGL